MELWTIGNKAAVLGYVVAAAYLADSESAVNPWHMLAYLLYLALNIAVPIVKKQQPKRLLVALSAASVIVFAVRLNPLFLLLLPVNAHELLSLPKERRLLTLTAMVLPVLLLPVVLYPPYLLCALLSYLLQACGNSMGGKLAKLEDERERTREDVHRLTRSLHENIDYIRQSEYTIKLEERNRLSQRIHDDIGHAMAGALIQMEASRRLLTSDRDKASELLGNAIAISKEGLERIRLTLKDMKPRSEELGINRLRLFVDELSTKETVTATLSHDGDLDKITPLQWKIIQQNTTEAVTNALKYAEATAIHVEVRMLNTFIKTVVTDNGKGAPKVVKGLGILGMEERSAAAGGTVIVDGTKGFSVTTLLPYQGT
ncbi:sensor histidine kinase [Paenibacillus hodogayensis]|uniref:histidine kinase n=1 Tax=Paenibacillus hodogayensis TaxID=279208 RepID=A0ABV5VZR2_9BACL